MEPLTSLRQKTKWKFSDEEIAELINESLYHQSLSQGCHSLGDMEQVLQPHHGIFCAASSHRLIRRAEMLFWW